MRLARIVLILALLLKIYKSNGSSCFLICEKNGNILLVKHLEIKKIMSIAFFEYFRRKNTYKTQLVVSFNAQKDIVINCS